MYLFIKGGWGRSPARQCLLVIVLHSCPYTVSTRAGFALLSLHSHMHTQERGFQGAHVEWGRFWCQRKQDLKTDSATNV